MHINRLHCPTHDPLEKDTLQERVSIERLELYPMHRRLAVLLTAASVLAPATAVLTPNTAHAFPGCTPIHVIQAAGTGYSNRAQTADPIPLYTSGWNPTDKLQQEFGVRNVAGFNVAYPASLGRINALTPGPVSSEAATYGESVLAGVETATAELTRVGRRCPSTKFFLVGYSQGASVIGNAAAEVAAGRVSHVKPEQIGGVVLVADPGRSPIIDKPTKGQADLAAKNGGVFAANGEIIVGGSTGVLPGRVGMTGARPTPFTGLEGTVISICDSNDMACSIHEGSLIRDVANFANRIDWPGLADDQTSKAIDSVRGQLEAGIPLDTALITAGLDWINILSITAALVEVASYLKIVVDHTRPDLNFAQLVALSLIAATPGLAAKGNTAEYLLPAAEGLASQVETLSPDAAAIITLATESTRLVFTAEEPFDAPGDGRASATRRDVSNLGQFIATQTGLSPLLEDPANANLIESMAVAGDFGFAHISYFDGHFKVGDRNGSDFADDWLAARAATILKTDSGSS